MVKNGGLFCSAPPPIFAAHMTPNLLIIDVNALGYAAMHQPALARLSHNGEPTAALHGALMSIFSRLVEYPSATPIAVWDGHARWRKELFPGYKSNRSDKPEKIKIREAYIKQAAVIEELLRLLGIPQVRSESAEADDVAGVICRNIDPAWVIQLVTRDTDWWQALDERTSWYSPLTKTSLTFDAFIDPDRGSSDGHFLSTQEYLNCKALAGDSSDTIPGLDKIGLKTAAKILREYGSLDALLARAKAGEVFSGAALLKLLAPGVKEMYERNLRLMDWKQAPPLDSSSVNAQFTQPDLEAFQRLADQYGLSRVATAANKLDLPAQRALWLPAWTDTLRSLGL